MGLRTIIKDFFNKEANIAAALFEDLLNRPHEENRSSELLWFFMLDKANTPDLYLLDLAKSGSPHHKEIFQRVIESDGVLQGARWSKNVGKNIEHWIDNRSPEQQCNIFAAEGIMETLNSDCDKYKIIGWFNEQDIEGRKIIATSDDGPWLLKKLGIDDVDLWVGEGTSNDLSSDNANIALTKDIA